MTERDPQVASARRALLDALDALGPHRDAVILVGAQAIYLHTGEADLVQLAEPYLSGWRHKIITDPGNWADGSIGALRV